MRFKKLSVLMPMYNEEMAAAANIMETDGYFRNLGIEYEIVVMDDGSKDFTYDSAMKASREYIKVYKLPKNEGKGEALREAFNKCTGDLVMFLDGDLDIHPKQFEVLFDILSRENADVVIGSKRHPQSILNYPTGRKILSAGYFFIVKAFFGLPLRDTQTGIKLFKAEVLKKVFHKVLIKRYAFDLELLILAHHHGFKIAEAPVVVDYKGKYGHINLKLIFKMLWDTMAIFYRLRILKYYDKI
ncbi:MAG: glycosyltransferase [Spirochaetia bacterium]|nr:glycosyltransferase [Spirochaetia bacterium]